MISSEKAENSSKFENTRPLPVHEKWIIPNNPDETVRYIQLFDSLLLSLKNFWMNEDKQHELYEKFVNCLSSLENTEAHSQIVVKIEISQTVCLVTISTKDKTIHFQELNLLNSR